MDQVRLGHRDTQSTGSVDLIHPGYPDPPKIISRCISKAPSQSMTPIPETFLTPEREILEGDASSQGELEIDEIGEKSQKKLKLGI